jgi:hypothetical protein
MVSIMSQDEIPVIKRILQAIHDDWAICDDSDDLDHMVLVNECREVMDDLKPKKRLIQEMEQMELIETPSHYGEREYIDFGKSRTPVHFVYTYFITDKGYALLHAAPPST